MEEDGYEGSKRRGPMTLDPSLDAWRLPPSDRCWWCGAAATTMEHRIKHSTLRRIARDDQGTIDPSNVFKRADDYEGTLRSVKRGSQVKWPKNMCADCNNTRSQSFDLAHDQMEAFIIQHADNMMDCPRLTWADVYGRNWESGASNLGRYFAKQVACMLATQRLPIPDDLIAFLNGGRRCPSVTFMVYRDWLGGVAHEAMRRDGSSDGLMSFIGLSPANAYERDGAFSGVDYGYHIGYVWFFASWERGSDRNSWWEYPSIDLPLIHADQESKALWARLRQGMIAAPGAKRLKRT